MQAGGLQVGIGRRKLSKAVLRAKVLLQKVLICSMPRAAFEA